MSSVVWNIKKSVVRKIVIEEVNESFKHWLVVSILEHQGESSKQKVVEKVKSGSWGEWEIFYVKDKKILGLFRRF